MDAGGLFRAFVDVCKQAFERFRVVVECSDVRGDRFESADHALDVLGGLEIGDERLRRAAIAGAQDDRLGAFLRDDGEAAFAQRLLGGIPPFFECRLPG